MKLSKRLTAIAQLVNKNARLADIACDHGLLGLYLLEREQIDYLVLSDINQNALNNAKANAKRMNLTPVFNLNTGLVGINLDSIDTIVIAGVGAKAMIDILKDNMLENKHIILSPQTQPEKVRAYMQSAGYKQVSELIICEHHKYYFIMSYISGKTAYNKFELLFGPHLLINKNKDYAKYLELIILKLQHNIKQMKKHHLKRLLANKYLIFLYKKALREVS